MSDPHYDHWRENLAGKNPPVHDGDPQPGYYRRRFREGRTYGPWLPAAIYFDDGKLTAEVNGVITDPIECWNWLAKNPISDDAYYFHKEHGRWPDAAESSGEEWRTYRNTGYFVSNHGHVRSPSGEVLAHRLNQEGYDRACLRYGSEEEDVYVHRMVCIAFNGEPPTPEHEADHINKIRNDNVPKNLQWVTKEESLANREMARGEANGRAKLTEDDIRRIRFGNLYEKRDQEIGDELGVDRRTITDVRLWKTWKHIVDPDSATAPEAVAESAEPAEDPDPELAELTRQIDAERDRARPFYAAAKPGTPKSGPDALADISIILKRLSKKIDEMRLERNRPHREWIAANDSYFRPAIEHPLKIAAMLDERVEKWIKAEVARQKEEAAAERARLAEERRAAAEAAEQKRREFEGTSSAAPPAAAPPIEETRAPPPAEKVLVGTGMVGRRTSGARQAKQGVIMNYVQFATHLINGGDTRAGADTCNSIALQEELQKIANGLARNGTAIPGMKIE